jgi:curli biogenesis system outer membrane secretion channel CsgG
MAYETPPEPGTYYIKSVAAPKNVVEAYDFNPERIGCSPQTEKAVSNQQVSMHLSQILVSSIRSSGIFNARDEVTSSRT